MRRLLGWLVRRTTVWDRTDPEPVVTVWPPPITTVDEAAAALRYMRDWYDRQADEASERSRAGGPHRDSPAFYSGQFAVYWSVAREVDDLLRRMGVDHGRVEAAAVLPDAAGEAGDDAGRAGSRADGPGSVGVRRDHGGDRARGGGPGGCGAAGAGSEAVAQRVGSAAGAGRPAGPEAGR